MNTPFRLLKAYVDTIGRPFVVLLIFLLLFQQCHCCKSFDKTCLLRRKCEELCQTTLIALPPLVPLNQSSQNVNSLINECVKGCSVEKDEKVFCDFPCQETQSICAGSCLLQELRLSKLGKAIKNIQLSIVQRQSDYLVQWSLENGTGKAFSYANYNLQLREDSSSTTWNFLQTNVIDAGNGTFSALLNPGDLKYLLTYEIRLAVLLENLIVVLSNTSRFTHVPLSPGISIPEELFKIKFEILNDDQVLIEWNGQLGKFVPATSYRVRTYDQTSSVSYASENLNGCHYVLSNLQPGHKYEAKVEAVEENGQIAGASGAVTFEVHEFKSRRSPRLFYANQSHVHALVNVDDFVVQQNPVEIFNTKSSAIVALAFGEGNLYVAVANESLHLIPMEGQISAISIMPIRFPVKAMTFETAQKNLLMASGNKVVSCDLGVKRCVMIMEITEDIEDLVSDSANGYLYISTSFKVLRCPLIRLRNEELSTIFQSSHDQSVRLAIDYSTNSLMFNQNDTIFAYNFFSNSVKDIRSDRLSASTSKSHSNVTALAANEGRAFWIANPCSDSLSALDDSCLFAEEELPSGDGLNLHNYLLPPGHGLLIGLATTESPGRFSIIPKPDLDVFFLSTSVQMFWTIKKHLPFQAPLEWRDFKYEIEITDNDRIVTRRKKIVGNNYKADNLLPYKKYLCRVRACAIESSCSSWSEAYGTTLQSNLTTLPTFIALMDNGQDVQRFHMDGSGEPIQYTKDTVGQLIALSNLKGQLFLINGTTVYPSQPTGTVPIKLEHGQTNGPIKIVAYEPIGEELYWSMENGVFRQSIHQDMPLRVSTEGNVKWMKLMSNHGLLVLATMNTVRSLYLTGYRGYEYYKCDNRDCSLLALVSNDDSDEIYYAIQNGQTVRLMMSMFNSTLHSKVIYETTSPNVDWTIWSDINQMFYVHEKVFILTSKGDFFALENDLSQASKFPSNLIRSIAFLPSDWSEYATISATREQLSLSWSTISKNEPGLKLLFNNTLKELSLDNVEAQTYYAIALSPSSAKINSTSTWTNITSADEVLVPAKMLTSDYVVVNATATKLWRRLWSANRMQVPLTYPEPPEQTLLNVAYVKSPYNKTATVRFSWSPCAWNGQPKSYKVYCWTFETNSTRRLYIAKGVEISHAEYYYNIRNLENFDEIIYCQVSCINFGMGESRLSKPIYSSTSEDSPASVLLLVSSSSLQLQDIFYNFEKARSTIGQFESAAYGKDNVYAIRSSMDGYNIVKLHSLDLAVLDMKLPISKQIVKATAMLYDWVGERLIIAARSRQYFHTEGDSLWSVATNLEEEPQQLLTTEPGNEIMDIAYDPFEGAVHMVISYGGNYALKSWRRISQTLEQSQCRPSSSALALQFLNPFNISPSLYTVTEEGVVNAQNCQPVIRQDELPGIDMTAVVSLAFDKYYVYLASEGSVFIFNQVDRNVTVMDTERIAKIRSVNEQYQPMPEYQCLQLPAHLKNFDTVVPQNGQIRITMELAEPLPECQNIVPPGGVYSVRFRPVHSSLEHCAGCILASSHTPTITLNGLRQDTNYVITAGWRNAYSKIESYHVGLLSQYIGHIVMADDLEAVPVAPDKIRLFWLAPIVGKAMKYEITIRHGEEQLLPETMYCDTTPCQHLVESLKPSTTYTFQVFTQDIPKGEQPPVKLNKIVMVPATTFEMPGHLGDGDVSVGETWISFVYKFLPNAALKEFLLEYQILDHDDWTILTADEVEKKEEKDSNDKYKRYKIDNLQPGQTCQLRASAVYVITHEYNHQIYNLRESFWQQLQPLSTKSELSSKMPLVTVMKTSAGYHLRWTLPDDIQPTAISLYIISYRSDENSQWTTLTELPPSDNGWPIPEGVALNKRSAFRVEAITDEGLTTIGHWTKETDAHLLSAGAIAAIIIGSILLVSLLVVVVLCNMRRRRHRPKAAMIQRMTNVNRVKVTANDAEVLGRIPPEEIAALPHIPRSCISLIREIGRGAFGEVYQGLAYNLPKYGSKTLQVAVKTLRPQLSPEQRVRFIKEAILMSRFDHPNVVALLGVCLETEPHWIILELMEAGDLLKYLRSVRATENMPSQVSIKDLVAICSDVANGCAYLEQLHHVHRDLAARNCLITSRNASMRTVKIGDFGLTRDLYEEDYYRVEGQGLLPVRWMAPESMIDGIFTTKSDVWSFGVLLWEVMTFGRQPYNGRSNWEVLNHVRIGGKLDRPDSCPTEMFDLMQACWSFEANDRPTFSLVLHHLLKLRDLPEYQSEQPFPPRDERSSTLTTGGTTPNDTLNTYSDETAHVLAGRNSARFVRSKNAASSNSKKKGSSMRLFRQKNREPIARPPSKEEINASPIPSFARRSIDLSSSSGTYTPMRGSETYEIPLIRDLQNSARENERIMMVEREKTAYRNLAMDNSDVSSERSSQNYDAPAALPRRRNAPQPPVNNEPSNVGNRYENFKPKTTTTDM